MANRGIEFFNRYTGKVETEEVYGEQWLRFILFNPFTYSRYDKKNS